MRIISRLKNPLMMYTDLNRTAAAWVLKLLRGSGLRKGRGKIRNSIYG